MRILRYPEGMARLAAAMLLVLATFGSSGISAAGATDLFGPTPADATQGGELKIGMSVEPPALDPFHQAADARIWVSVLMYQGLMYEDASGVAKPLLAKTMDVADGGKTYTFKLRENVKFHTGEEMTSADVKYSYDYIRDKKNGSPAALDYSDIESIDTPDDFTVVFRLKRSNAALPMILTNTFGAVVPKGYFDTPNAIARLNQQSVGTGPFKLASFQRNSYLQLARNEDYWEPDTPYLDKVTFLFLPNSASQVVALQSGRVDLALLNRPQDVAQLKSAENLTVETFPSLVHASLDLDGDLSQLKDVRVRQAIALAIDKEQVLQAAFQGYGTVLGTTVAGMQDTWGLPLDQVPFQKPDPDRAKKLLAEAGHADGLDIDLITIVGYDWMDAAAVTIAEQLKAVGITAHIKKLDLGVWIHNLDNHRLGFTFNEWGIPPDPDLLYYRHFHERPEGEDFRNWNNAKASKLLDEGRQETDLEKRKQDYVEFQKVLGETVPTIFLVGPDLIVARNDRVKNYVQHPTRRFFGLIRTYLEQ